MLLWNLLCAGLHHVQVSNMVMNGAIRHNVIMATTVVTATQEQSSSFILKYVKKKLLPWYHHWMKFLKVLPKPVTIGSKFGDEEGNALGSRCSWFIGNKIVNVAVIKLSIADATIAVDLYAVFSSNLWWLQFSYHDMDVCRYTRAQSAMTWCRLDIVLVALSVHSLTLNVSWLCW